VSRATQGTSARASTVTGRPATSTQAAAMRTCGALQSNRVAPSLDAIPCAFKNAANSALVTLSRSIQKSPTWTRCRGAASTAPSSRPIENVAAGTNMMPSAIACVTEPASTPTTTAMMSVFRAMPKPL
jgi:hypothetical protein